MLLLVGCADALGGYFTFIGSHPTKQPVMVRHCSFNAYATTNHHGGPGGDYIWKVVPALNGKHGAVSLQPSNYLNKYLTISRNVELEDGRLGAGECSDEYAPQTGIC
jgi:hypothetical protein